ncbi:hypothetical protein [Proteus columbae]|uniref:hypothetical protein n=1 Tax=Proteus columbae TaxID=1987580 RepID=UPI0034D5C7ED
MRELLSHPSAIEFTQGSIFEGLNSNQDGNYTHAIIVTAKCDIANNKARNILCLPIYKAEDWINNHGDEIVFRRIEVKLENKLKTELNSLKISFETLNIYPLESIISLVEQKQKKNEEIKMCIEMYYSKKCNYNLKFVADERKNLVSTLINNTENSIYFLERIDFDELIEPHIIDLANPVSIPYCIAKKLSNGINRNKTNSSKNKQLIEQYLTIYKPEISYISILKSPYIEHVLQKFSSYYSRIGTDDIEKELRDILKEKLNEI